MNRIFLTGAVEILILASLLSGCDHRDHSANEASSGHHTNAPKVKGPADPWIVTETDATDPTPALLWNGLIGVRIGRDGTGKGQPFFAIDEYDTTGEEKIRTLPNPLPNGFLVDGKPLPITGDYQQTLNMKTSELTAKWKSGDLSVECVTVMHPTERKIGQRWTLKGSGKAVANVDFDAGMDSKMAGATVLGKNITLGPSGMKGLFWAKSTETGSIVVDYVLSLGRSPNFQAMSAARGKSGVFPAAWSDVPPIIEFSDLQTQARKIWAERWKTDIEIDGPVEDQQAIHSFLFYLRSAVSLEGGMSISPFGLSNQMYNGHVFWDADIWVFPALALIAPDQARSIIQYRESTLNSARINYTSWLKDGRPIANSKMGMDQSAKTDGIGVKYPWESSVSGRETVPGNSKFEDHITGDVWFAAHQARLLGLNSESRETALSKDAARFFLTRSAKNANGTYDLNQTISPDESRTADNDLYTNLLAQYCFDASGTKGIDGKPLKMSLPHDSSSFLTYDGDPLKAYKQAAAVLSIYPLQYEPAESEGKTMMDRFADKATKNGPAMSDSVNALIWSRLGDRDRAYQTWLQSWQPFTQQPLLLFSEKRTKPTTYFTTGAGGTLQTVLFGFLGFRLDSVKEQDAAWSTPLQGGWLSAKPNFPREWKSVKITNFTVLGHHFTLTATHRPNGPDAAQVIQGD